MPSGTGIAPPRCHPPPDGGTLRHVNNSLPGPVSEGSVHGNGSRQPDNWLLALAEPFVTVLAHGNGVFVYMNNFFPFFPYDIVVRERKESIISVLIRQKALFPHIFLLNPYHCVTPFHSMFVFRLPKTIFFRRELLVILTPTVSDFLHHLCCFQRNGRLVCAAPVQNFDIAQVISHPDYNKPNRFWNDIALIRLNKTATFNRECSAYRQSPSQSVY